MSVCKGWKEEKSLRGELVWPGEVESRPGCMCHDAWVMGIGTERAWPSWKKGETG